MSTGPHVEQELDEYRQERIEGLAEAAVSCRPRLFAIHGLRHSTHGGILGWGMEFPDDNRAIFIDPAEHSVHHSNNAEQVLELLSIVGDVRLTWLDPE
jgi:hypothetical protein